jgi:hypothetical protein
MLNSEEPRICKGPGCTHPLPPPKPGHKPVLTCSAACRKAASRAHLRAEARRQEEAARHQRLARWQTFQPTTQHLLAQIEAHEGVVVAEALAEAIRSEVTQVHVTADLAMASRHE